MLVRVAFDKGKVECREDLHEGGEEGLKMGCNVNIYIYIYVYISEGMSLLSIVY